TPRSATLSVSVVHGRQPTTSDYALSYDGAKYTLTDRAPGSVVGTATPSSTPPTLTIGGLKLSLSSTPNAGDAFTVLPTRGAL
ncbi:flagellar hook-associated protein FlgK, partial [Burkholderia pseudomallei]